MILFLLAFIDFLDWQDVATLSVVALPRMKGLLLVAHPDDELIFAGGALLSTPDIEWEICTATYEVREPRFLQLLRSVELLNEHGANVRNVYTLGLPDEGTILHVAGRTVWDDALARKSYCFSEPDFVLTHNRLGEYGHPHHMTLAEIAVDRVACPLYHFYCQAPSSVRPQERLDETAVLTLTPDLAETKLRIFEEAYGAELLQSLRTHVPELMDYASRYEGFTSAAAD